MALDNPSGTPPEGQPYREADEGHDLPPIGYTILNRTIQPADRWRDHQGAGDNQPSPEDALAKPAAPRANWPIREDKSDKYEIDEVDW